MWRRLGIVLYVGCSLFLGGRLAASSICVSVTALTGQPIQSAGVLVADISDPSIRYSTDLDADGKACVERMPEGQYSVEVQPKGHGYLHVTYYPVEVKFPEDCRLEFRLPYGEITEGGIWLDVLVSGTLREGDTPAPGVKICLFNLDKDVPAACTETNELAQYAVRVAPARYRLELSRSGKLIQSRTIDISSPMWFRNRISMPLARGRGDGRQ